MKTTEIQSTSSYDIFRPHGEQRHINPSHVKNLAKSMLENGYIIAHPIHVYREGNTYRIIDGHHRHAAAKSAGVELRYVVTQKADAGLIAVTNQCMKQWRCEDFIRMYSARGMGDYMILTSYMDKGLCLNLAAALLRGEFAPSGNSHRAIVNGTYKVKTRAHADEILRVVNAVAPINSEARSRSFLSSLAVLLRLECFSAAVFISRVEANPRALTKCASRQQMLEQIEEIYNFRARDKINLAFLATERMKSGQENFGRGKGAA